MATTLTQPFARALVPLAIALAPACKSDAPREDTPSQANASPPAANDEPSAAVRRDEEPTGPLEWLDPKANGVAWIDLPPDLSPAAIATVFALPPRASALLEAPHEVDEAMAAITGEPDVAQWFSGPALVTTSLLTTGPYVIRSLAKPRETLTSALQGAQFTATTVEGFAILTPARAFGWRVVMLDASTVAFIPLREPGSGLSPLTAGRDLPASDLERDLSHAVEEDSTLKVALFSAGPMLHFDVEPSLRAARLELRMSGGALDGRVMFEPESDVADVANALSQRTLPEETEQIRQLVSEVGYTVDGELVLGRLQVTPTKIAALRILP
jgi:hypothetical protein